MSSPADHSGPETGSDPSVSARVEQLYASHAAVIRLICRSLLRDRLEAEDATQQTFLSVQRALLNGSVPQDATAWLATIARHECLARVRERMREPLPTEIEEAGEAPDAHTVAVRRHEISELRDALAKLPAQQREAVLLREFRGLSYQEVASSLAVTTSAAESLLFRARRSLRTQLEGTIAALSPLAWLKPLREFAARIAGDGVATPAAAKIAAVGVGTAIVAGGALIRPTMLDLGHTHRQRGHAHRLVAAAPVERSAATPWSRTRSHPGQVALVTRSKAGALATSDSIDRSRTSHEPPSHSQDRERSDAGDTARPASNSERGDNGDGTTPSSTDDSQTSTDESQTSTTDDTSTDPGSTTPTGPDGPGD